MIQIGFKMLNLRGAIAVDSQYVMDWKPCSDHLRNNPKRITVTQPVDKGGGPPQEDNRGGHMWTISTEVQ